MKRILTSTLIFCSSFLISCSGGDPSISILPSKDLYTQNGAEIIAKMDILWVIDNSGSMDNFQTTLRNNFATFIQGFTENDYDYKMAVITSDAWRDLDFSSGEPVVVASPSFSDFKASSSSDTVLTPDSTDVITKFQEMTSVGTAGTGDERVLQSIRAGLENPNNAGFLRDDAHLSVIIVSDEDDFSTKSTTYLSTTFAVNSPADFPDCAGGPLNNPDNTINSDCVNLTYWSESNLHSSGNFLTPVSEYKDYLDSKSGDTFGATVHNMAVLDNSCRTLKFPGDAFNYFRLIGQRTSDLANLTDGTVSSLCDNFADSLTNIAQKIVEKTVEFRLSSVPLDHNSIIVEINNVEIAQDATNGWTYNDQANSIVFHGTGIPPQGAQLNIYYDPNSL